MGKEIERKYTIDPKLDKTELLSKLHNDIKKISTIKEYYFNDTTRLRNIDGKWVITVKSLNTFIRDEFEFEIKNIDFIPAPLMIKDRFYIPYFGHTFELNIFRNLFDKNGNNIMIVEVELENENEEITLPEWIDHDVTNHPSFYGYNIYKKFLDDFCNRKQT